MAKIEIESIEKEIFLYEMKTCDVGVITSSNYGHVGDTVLRVGGDKQNIVVNLTDPDVSWVLDDKSQINIKVTICKDALIRVWLS